MRSLRCSAAGALVGVVAAQALAGHLVVVTAVGLAAGATLGGLGQAAGWWVLLRAGRSARVLRALPWALALVVAVTIVGAARPAAAGVAGWSGPWGWFALAVVGSVTGRTAQAGVAVAALVLAAATGAWWALRSRAAPPTEELARRAGAAAGAAATLYLHDLTGLAELRAESLEALKGRPRARLPAPRRARWAILWRDATVLARSPGRLAAGAALAVTAGVVVVVATGLVADAGAEEAMPLARAGAFVVAGLVGVRGAARLLLGPLCGAFARPFGHGHLPWSHVRLLARHCALPAVSVPTLTTVGGLAAALVAGHPPRLWAPAVTTVTVTAAGLVFLEAARLLEPPEDPVAAVESVLTETAAMARAFSRWPTMLLFAALVAPAVAAVLGAGATAAPVLALTAGAVGAAAGGTAWWRLARAAPPWDLRR